jgi:predicted nuclease of predicted toxin-antitoxin system
MLSPSISDEVVLETANLENRILLTFDSDFGELIFRRKLKTRGIILLKFTPKSYQHVTEIIMNLLASQTKIEGHFLLVTEKRIRIHRLKTPKN